MGRKIPAKKHRGVKDPLVQQARRFENLKNKINAPPRDPDEQPIPKSLIRLFGTQSGLEDKKKEKRGDKGRIAKRKDKVYHQGGTQPGLKKLKQLPGETGRDFSRRITGAIRALHQADDALHYPKEEEEDDDSNHRRPRRNAKPGAPKESRAKRRAEKLKVKKQQLAEARAADAVPEVQYERVSFGDIAHAPPSLTKPRRAPDNNKLRRGLLLASTLSSEDAETRRVAAVDAYRALKKERALQAAQARKR